MLAVMDAIQYKLLRESKLEGGEIKVDIRRMRRYRLARKVVVRAP